MAKLHFEMEFSLDQPEESDLPTEWILSFVFDDHENSIDFTVVDGDSDVPGDRYEGIPFVGWLKVVGQEADGAFVNSLYNLASAHVDLNLQAAYEDYYSQD